MSPASYAEDLHRAFIAGANFVSRNTRVVNDGDGHVDVIEPTEEEIELAAESYWRKP